MRTTVRRHAYRDDHALSLVLVPTIVWGQRFFHRFLSHTSPEQNRLHIYLENFVCVALGFTTLTFHLHPTSAMASRPSLEYDYLFKIVLVGDAAVGKTNLLACYTSQVL